MRFCRFFGVALTAILLSVNFTSCSKSEDNKTSTGGENFANEKRLVKLVEKYTLNSTGYGWWLDHCYSYNDADHVVLAGEAISINRVRLTSSYITGIVILGDDLTVDSDSETKKRLEELAGNREVVAMAHQTKAFYPVEANTGHPAPNMFMYTVADTTYVAALNYDAGRRLEITIDFDRLGLTTGTEYVVRELWTGQESIATESFEDDVRRADAAIYKIYPKPDDSSIEGVQCNDTRCYYDSLVGEVRMKGASYMVESYVYTIGGACVIWLRRMLRLNFIR